MLINAKYEEPVTFLPFLPLKSMKMCFGFAQLFKFDLVLDPSFLLSVVKLFCF